MFYSFKKNKVKNMVSTFHASYAAVSVNNASKDIDSKLLIEMSH